MITMIGLCAVLLHLTKSKRRNTDTFCNSTGPMPAEATQITVGTNDDM